jgi:hypothetical protein
MTTVIVWQRGYTQGVKARIAAASAFLLVLYAQDAPRSKASDYPAHISISGMEIGPEYLVHSIPAEKGDYFAKEYLVVEVAIFPVTKNSLKISSGHFTLGINRKSTLSAQSAGRVAAALKYPDWEQRPQMTAQAGPVIYGAPCRSEDFPAIQQRRAQCPLRERLTRPTRPTSRSNPICRSNKLSRAPLCRKGSSRITSKAACSFALKESLNPSSRWT